MERLVPDPGTTTISDELERLDPVSRRHDERPFLYTNFALTLDGRATLGGRSGPIASVADTEMLVGLREHADAVMIGAGTLRAERYGRFSADAGKRARRERRGLPAEPLAVVVTRSLDLPWDAGMFADGGRVLVITCSEDEPPEVAAGVEVLRYAGVVDLPAAMRHLRSERGVRSLLCEGGPHLHGNLVEAELVDELFVTISPKLAGGSGPRLIEGIAESERALELQSLLAEGGELFARYAVRG